MIHRSIGLEKRKARTRRALKTFAEVIARERVVREGLRRLPARLLRD